MSEIAKKLENLEFDTEWYKIFKLNENCTEADVMKSYHRIIDELEQIRENNPETYETSYIIANYALLRASVDFPTDKCMQIEILLQKFKRSVKEVQKFSQDIQEFLFTFGEQYARWAKESNLIFEEFKKFSNCKGYMDEDFLLYCFLKPIEISDSSTESEKLRNVRNLTNVLKYLESSAELLDNQPSFFFFFNERGNFTFSIIEKDLDPDKLMEMKFPSIVERMEREKKTAVLYIKDNMENDFGSVFMITAIENDCTEIIKKITLKTYNLFFGNFGVEIPSEINEKLEKYLDENISREGFIVKIFMSFNKGLTITAHFRNFNSSRLVDVMSLLKTIFMEMKTLNMAEILEKSIHLLEILSEKNIDDICIQLREYMKKYISSDKSESSVEFSENDEYEITYGTEIL